MTTTAEPKIVSKIKTKAEIPEPLRYNVIFINDEVTTQTFVVDTLVVIFNYEQMAAEEMTLQIHKDGSAVVATLPYEMAEQKGLEVTMLARNNGFPLVVKLEPEA